MRLNRILVLRRTNNSHRMLRFESFVFTCLTYRVLSIMTQIPEISVGIQIERFVSVSSDRNIQDHLWRWSTYFGQNIPTEIHHSIYGKPVLSPN